MGDNLEHREGPQSGSSGDHRALDDPRTQTDVKASRAGFNARKSE